MKKPQTQAAIAKILADAKEGDLFTVVFAPITSAVWIGKNTNGEAAFVDAVGDGIYSDTLAKIATLAKVDVTIRSKRDGGKVSLAEEDSAYLWTTASYITSITTRASSTSKASVDGLSYEMVFSSKTGECKVGCQTLTRTGCEQAFRALGAHLGYEITD